MGKYTGLWDSTTLLQLYVTVLLTFYIVKKQQTLSFAAINARGLYLRFCGEEYFCFGSLCFVKLTGLLSIFLPTTHSYVIKSFQN